MKIGSILIIAGTVLGLWQVTYGQCPEKCDGNSPYNTALGSDALFSLTSGSSDTAIGFQTLYKDSNGSANTAVGYKALYFNTSGSYNTGIGRGALYKNTVSSQNTAMGYQALNNNIGGGNVATGYQALWKNTTGTVNTALGTSALSVNTTGNYSTATGAYALARNTSGYYNTAYGYGSLFNDTTGFNNTALGNDTLYGNSTGSNNIAIGVQAGYSLSTGTFNIDIGNMGAAGESATIRIGTNGNQANTYIAGISGVTVAGGIGVIVDSSGHLGTTTSSARYKEKIQPMDRVSEAVLSLRPVTFHYKKAIDPDGIQQFGLVAEQVEEVNPDLVAYDDQRKPYSVRYEAVNAMLLNEFLKEHSKVETQGSEIAELKATVAELKSAFKRQAIQIREVSAQLAADRSVSRMVLNE